MANGEKVKAVKDFIFFGSKITADGACIQEIKSCLLLGKKAMRNLDSVLKNQRRQFANKGPQSQSYGFFLVVMYECESWTIKKTECQRNSFIYVNILVMAIQKQLLT